MSVGLPNNQNNDLHMFKEDDIECISVHEACQTILTSSTIKVSFCITQSKGGEFKVKASK